MYIPPAFAETRLDVLHGAIRATGLATLVTFGPDGLAGTPLPLMVDPEDGANGTLYGHVARANPQWRRSDPAVEALALFSGPDAYVSPGWYATKAATHKVVPTWNYVTVHAYGVAEFFEDATELLEVVTRLTRLHEARLHEARLHEAGQAAPWAVSDAPADFVRAQLKGIVGMRMRITRIEGKWKMSQNRDAADRAGAAAGLRAGGHEVVAGMVEG